MSFRIRNTFVYSLLILAGMVTANAQEVGWNIHFHGFADNREYAKSGRYSQSILGMRLAPELLFSVDSTHELHVGINLLHEFGADSRKTDRVLPMVYYHFSQSGHDFYIGMFPRKALLGNYHRLLLTDTLQYYRPNVEGMLWRFGKRTFHEQVWIDWTSRQTRTDREQFMVGFSGLVKPGRWYVAHQVTLWHDAGRMVEDDEDEQPVRDNGAALVKLGTDLSRMWFLDSADISVGAAFGYDRLRGIYGWNLPVGFIADVYAEYRKVFIANTVYAGEPMNVAYGDRFYMADFYNRLELGWKPLQFKGLESRFTLSFHFSKGAIDNQQQFSLHYDLGRLYPKQR